MFENLLKPGRIGKLDLKNRMIMAPMATDFAGVNDEVTPRMIEYYRRRAQGGASLICVEAAYVMDDGGVGRAVVKELGLYRDTFMAEMGELVDAVHEAGAKIAIQPHHGGRQAYYPNPVSISDIPCGYYKTPVRKLSIKELEDIEDAFAKSAGFAKNAGFDAIQLHFANGYLAQQSLSKLFNNRTDSYGGSFDNRLRFCLNVIRKTRKVVGPDYTLFCRMASQEFLEGGLTIEDTKLIAREFEKAGLDAIDLNNGIRQSVIYTIPSARLPRGFASDLAMELKSAVSIPVIIAGRINDPYLAEDILAKGKADFIALGRPLIADPDFPKKVAENRPKDIRTCIACNIGCRGKVMKGLHIRCTVNPVAGREIDLFEQLPESIGEKKVVVVGGGPAGLIAAEIASRRGYHVTLFEKTDKLGGDQLALGQVPPFKEELATIPEYYENQFKKLSNLKVKLGVEASVAKIMALKPDVVVIATGSRAQIPPIEYRGNAIKVITARDVLAGTEVGENVVVVGGNSLGCETAEWLAQNGKKVTIVEMRDDFLTDTDSSVKYDMLRTLQQLKVGFIKGSTLLGVTPEGAIIQDHGGNRQEVKCDGVIFATGAVPERGLFKKLQNKGVELYVVGDATKPGQIIDAIAESYRVARSM